MLLVLSTISLFAATLAPPPVQQARSAGQVRVQRRVVIRVPRLAMARTAVAASAMPPIRWEERDTDRCVPASSLAAAAVTRSDSLDLMTTGGKRLRANLGRKCPALDFYNGFYLRPASDGMVCADRDSVRSRSGGACLIQSFRALVPAR